MGVSVQNGRDSHDTPAQNRLDVALILRDLGYIKDRIDQICKADDEYDKRLIKVEKLTWAGVVLLSVATPIFIVVTAAAIKMWLGLP